VSLWRRLAATQPYDRISPLDNGGVPLRRALGVAGLIGVGLGTMLGGIFTTIGSGAQAAGAGGVAGVSSSVTPRRLREHTRPRSRAACARIRT